MIFYGKVVGVTSLNGVFGLKAYLCCLCFLFFKVYYLFSIISRDCGLLLFFRFTSLVSVVKRFLFDSGLGRSPI